MSTTPSILNAQRFSDRDLIEAVVSQFFILDYGFVEKVNEDGTVNVTHAVKPLSITGDSLDPITTENVEVLTFSTAEIAFDYSISQGDKVLLLGLRNVVDKVDDVTQAKDATSRLHYSRETMKALPLCVFNSDSKVQVKADSGKLSIKVNDTIELNGNSKQFVTWTELNTALTTFVTNLNAALAAATYVNAAGTPTVLAWTSPLPTQIDISAAKTTTVVTGG